MAHISKIEEKTFLIDSIADLLVIPRSFYKKAENRYRSLSEWLKRSESNVAELMPQVYPQGSFRYGTVIRPLRQTDENEEYDLDLVCEINLNKESVTQHYVKDLLGEEIKSYAKSNGILEPIIERNRCWRINYADEVKFHVDALPCVPEDQRTINEICSKGVDHQFAEESVAITDNRDQNYNNISCHWTCSNPRGIGKWFEEIARPSANKRLKELVENRAYSTIESIPSYEWDSPLQRAIQILKRHRDVMFASNPRFAPISMIITVLSCLSYKGEISTYDALKGILDRMPQFIGSNNLRIPNPVNPNEDFAEKWKTDSNFEKNFRNWHLSAKSAVEILPSNIGDIQLSRFVWNNFRVKLTEQQEEILIKTPVYEESPNKTKTLHIAKPARPWKIGGRAH